MARTDERQPVAARRGMAAIDRIQAKVLRAGLEDELGERLDLDFVEDLLARPDVQQAINHDEGFAAAVAEHDAPQALTFDEVRAAVQEARGRRRDDFAEQVVDELLDDDAEPFQARRYRADDKRRQRDYNKLKRYAANNGLERVWLCKGKRNDELVILLADLERVTASQRQWCEAETAKRSRSTAPARQARHGG